MSDLNQIIRDIADIKRQQSIASRHGVVTDVKDGKVRMSMGYRDDGSPLKGPWTFPGQHSGIKREDTPFRVGQNVTMEMPGGDPRQARMLPFGPNEANPRPIHASEDASTSQHPHFDKDGKEEKDKDKPGFQRTESSTERTTVMDKISSHSQTKTNQTREILDKVGGKAKSLIDQTFGALSRKLDDGKGASSSLTHTAAEVLHKVGEKASHSHTAQGFVRQVGGAKLQHLADKVMHLVGGHSSEMTSGGLKLLGGFISHDGKDIGGSHTHKVPGPFGMVMSLLPEGPGGGGGGDSGGGSGSGGESPVPEEMNWDMVPFAWGGFRLNSGSLQPYGRTRGLGFQRVDDLTWRANFTVELPYEDSDYRVSVNQEGPITLRITNKSTIGFDVVATEPADLVAWFLVLP